MSYDNGRHSSDHRVPLARQPRVKIVHRIQSGGKPETGVELSYLVVALGQPIRLGVSFDMGRPQLVQGG